MSKRNKGIHIHYRKDRNCWEIREFVHGKRKRHATGISCRADAEEQLAEILVKKQVVKQCTLISEILTFYINDHIPTISRPDIAIATMERLIPFWGDLSLDEINKSKSLEYYEVRKSEFKRWQIDHGQSGKRVLSKASVRRELEQLQAAISYAHKSNLIDKNPFVWKPDKSKPKTRWLTRNECAALLRAARSSKQAKEYLPLFILIGVYTGARMSAILKLKWTDIDLDRGLIDFTTNDTNGKKKGAKTIIPPKLLPRLKAQKKRSTKLGYVLHINQTPIKNPKKAFKTACSIAGLEQVTIHTLRHTCASWLMQASVSTVKIAKHLGHTSPRMIETTYGHLNPNHLDEIKKVFS